MIRLRFSRSHTTGSALIRAFTWSPWSHVDLVTSRGTYLGATTAGVLERDPRRVHDSAEAIYAIDGADYLHLAAVEGWMRRHIGKPYDWGGVIGIALRRGWDDPARWFCSELVTAALREAGIHLLHPAARPSRITPRDLTLSPLLRRAD